MTAFILLIASIFLAVFTVFAPKGKLIKDQWVNRGLIVLSVAMFLTSILPSLIFNDWYGPNEYSRTTAIQTLEEDESLPGHFVLGVGSDQGEDRYFFQTKEGKTGSIKRTARLVVETDSNDAYVENTTIVLGAYDNLPKWKKSLLLIDYIGSIPQTHSYSFVTIHVPLGTVVKEYNPNNP